MASKSVAIIGGGIAGLSAAYRLLKVSNGSCKITIIESASRLGGWIKSSVLEDGSVFEGGPRSMRPAGLPGREALNLVDELGLEKSIIAVDPSHKASSNRYIYVNNTLHLLPSGIMSLCKSTPPFTKSLLLSALREWRLRSNTDQNDESVYDFFERRFNNEIAKYLIDPLCRGIQAGDSKKLSMKSCFPGVYKYEEVHGSVVSGLLHDRPIPISDLDSPLVHRSKSERWRMWTLHGGLETLVKTLAETLVKRGVDIKLNSPCQKISFNAVNQVQVDTKEGVHEFDHIICALPASSLANSLFTEHSLLSNALSSIDSVTVAVVNLAYEGNVLPIEGFGYLIPSTENSKALGVVFDSCSFPQLNSKQRSTTRLTVMMGGAWFKELFATCTDDRNFIEVAMNTVRGHLGITSNPSFTKFSVYRDCIPQYTVGHSDRLDLIWKYISSNKLPITLVGASYKGISVNDCIYHANLAIDGVFK